MYDLLARGSELDGQFQRVPFVFVMPFELRVFEIEHLKERENTAPDRQPDILLAVDGGDVDTSRPGCSWSAALPEGVP